MRICPMCKGEGKFWIDVTEINPCPGCKGTGEIETKIEIDKEVKNG